MNDKKIKIYGVFIFAIVMLSITANVIYASSKEISEPLFIKLYKETVYNNNVEDLYISYITNTKDDRRVESISFDGLDSQVIVSQINYFGGFNFDQDLNQNPYNDSIGRYYTLKRAFIKINLSENDIKKLSKESSIILNRGIATFNDGSSMAISFGRIELHDEGYWEKQRIRDGGGGGGNHYNAKYKTKSPINITSLDVSSFEKHKAFLNMVIIFDDQHVYTYDDLKNNINSIPVNRRFEVYFSSNDEDASNDWRFNAIAMDMSYTMEDEIYETCLYYSFYDMGMTESSIEDYVDFRRTENE